MSDKRTLTTRVPESVASEWDDYVEANPDDVNSMSHLLRKGVNAYVNGSSEEPGEPSGEPVEASGEVLNALERIESKVEHVGEKVDTVERATYGGAGEWTEEVYNAVPEGEINALDPSTLSKVSGAPTAVVIETLDSLMEDMDVETDDNGNYYRSNS